MGNTTSETHAARQLINRCLAGDRAAIAQFQETYGELIYGYPLRVYHTPAEEAGDFYVFAFEKERIFRRLRTFEGRAPLRAYLLGFVLDDLVLQWKRGAREVETVSIDALNDPSAAMESACAEVSEATADADRWSALIDSLAPPKAVVMKLLHVEDYDLTPEEVRHIATVSGRSVREVLLAVDRLRATVREREAALKRVQDALEGVHAWIQLYERRLHRIAEDLGCLPPTTVAAERLRQERAELQHKAARRQQQRTKLMAQVRRRKLTAPYKDIAAVLNTSLGTIASQIARLRQELLARADTHDHGLGNGGAND